jgi:hypothetical protein
MSLRKSPPLCREIAQAFERLAGCNAVNVFVLEVLFDVPSVDDSVFPEAAFEPLDFGFQPNLLVIGDADPRVPGHPGSGRIRSPRPAQLVVSAPGTLDVVARGPVRASHARGRDFVVSPLSGPAYERVAGGLKREFLSPRELRRVLESG